MKKNWNRAWGPLAALAASFAMVACGGGGNSSGVAGLTAAPASGGSGTPPDTVTTPAKLSCDDSMKTAFKPDANTSVLLVKLFKTGDQILLSGTATPATPVAANDICLVKLMVGPGHPGPADAPSTTSGIGIEVWLPSVANWNKRLHMLGGAGAAGGVQATLTSVAAAPTAAPWSVAGVEGAVAATTDTGHPAGNSNFLMNPDGTINTVGWNEFSERGIHEMTVKSKALALAYYGTPASYTYWHGGSTGGRQGMKQAQLYPEDFDGIIASSPAINWVRFTGSQVWPQLVIQRDLAGVPLTAGQWTSVSTAAINACDMVGGQHLGYLLDPSKCAYDPTTDAQVLCTSAGGTNATASCLTQVQAVAVNKMWYGPTTDGSVPSPSVDNGLGPTLGANQIWFGWPRGSNLTVTSVSTNGLHFDQLALFLQDPTRAGSSFVNATGNGANRWRDLSYPDLYNGINRGLALEPLFSRISTDNPDLSKFRDRGGKIITVVGSSDQVIPHAGVINYYTRVATQMGGVAEVQKFYRLYTIPGMGHFPANGTANVAANPPLYPEDVNYQSLTDWVEKGIAPADKIVISSPVTSANPAAVTGAMCAYPKMPAYSSGDIKAAASYSCS
ncbi:tannase/feruloyl esterase family alpha/beta hydrolase [Variovorax sp. ZT5P49]|uniref:tannase/feruloyl esterase family alpha/beta hydrolase n=1 Tax=Variovorax sp. ZT5P49 TaxID=3443733 RepID=UPI003F47B90D